MRAKKLVIAFTAMAGIAIGQGAQLITNGSGLIVDTFPAGANDHTFTDPMGNTLTARGISEFVSGQWRFGSGPIDATFASPAAAAGFTFLATPFCCGTFTLIGGVSLNNGESYNLPTDITYGPGAPMTDFFGVFSDRPFTEATFNMGNELSFIITDFRFATVPEPATSGLITPALVALGAVLALHRRWRKS